MINYNRLGYEIKVYGFGAQPMLLLTNIEITEKKAVFNSSKSLLNAMDDRGIFQV